MASRVAFLGKVEFNGPIQYVDSTYYQTTYAVDTHTNVAVSTVYSEVFRPSAYDHECELVFVSTKVTLLHEGSTMNCFYQAIFLSREGLTNPLYEYFYNNDTGLLLTVSGVTFILDKSYYLSATNTVTFYTQVSKLSKFRATYPALSGSMASIGSFPNDSNQFTETTSLHPSSAGTFNHGTTSPGWKTLFTPAVSESGFATLHAYIGANRYSINFCYYRIGSTTHLQTMASISPVLVVLRNNAGAIEIGLSTDNGGSEAVYSLRRIRFYNTFN